MRVLVGAACFAVLAFVGYYFWGEYQKHEHQQFLVAQDRLAVEQEREKQEDLRALYIIANVTPGDEAEIARACKDVTTIIQQATGNSATKEMDEACKKYGYSTE